MLLCKDFTTRVLHQPAKDHLAAVKKRGKSSALGEYYWTRHPMAEPQLEFHIAYFTEKGELRLRKEEVIIIKHLSQAINRRMEDTGIDFLV